MAVRHVGPQLLRASCLPRRPCLQLTDGNSTSPSGNLGQGGRFVNNSPPPCFRSKPQSWPQASGFFPRTLGWGKGTPPTSLSLCHWFPSPICFPSLSCLPSPICFPVLILLPDSFLSSPLCLSLPIPVFFLSLSPSAPTLSLPSIVSHRLQVLISPVSVSIPISLFSSLFLTPPVSVHLPHDSPLLCLLDSLSLLSVPLYDL